MQPILGTNTKVLSLLPFSPRLIWFPVLAAIKIFGIFTLAQLRHRRFWDNLSQQLQQRGPDYVARCTFRNKPLSIDENVISPATFPSFPDQVQDTPQTAPLVKVREEDLKDVSEMVNLFRIH